jgi:hypothetical protein
VDAPEHFDVVRGGEEVLGRSMVVKDVETRQVTHPLLKEIPVDHRNEMIVFSSRQNGGG